MDIINYKQYLSESNKFRQSVQKYIKSKDYKMESEELTFQLLDEIDKKSETDNEFRSEAYKYFTCHPNYSTIELREICAQVGFDYWNDKNSTGLKIVNSINTIDTAQGYHILEHYPQHKYKFELNQLTRYIIDDSVSGNLTLNMPYFGLDIQNYIKTEFRDIGYELEMTRLYRVNFNDSDICTTWVDADIEPRIVDIIAVELNFQYVIIVADIGNAVMPIALDFRDGDFTITPIYENFKWIKKATTEQLQAICNAVAERFDESKNEVEALQTMK